MPGEMAQHETFSDAERAYRIEVHNLITDTVLKAYINGF